MNSSLRLPSFRLFRPNSRHIFLASFSPATVNICHSEYLSVVNNFQEFRSCETTFLVWSAGTFPGARGTVLRVRHSDLVASGTTKQNAQAVCQCSELCAIGIISPFAPSTRTFLKYFKRQFSSANSGTNDFVNVVIIPPVVNDQEETKIRRWQSLHQTITEMHEKIEQSCYVRGLK